VLHLTAVLLPGLIQQHGAALVGLADFDVKVALALHADAASPCTTILAGCMPFATATASSSLVRISVARACFLTDRAS
jgi:hypothetical protein